MSWEIKGLVVGVRELGLAQSGPWEGRLRYGSGRASTIRTDLQKLLPAMVPGQTTLQALFEPRASSWETTRGRSWLDLEDFIFEARS